MSLGLSGMVRVRAALVAPLLAMLAVGCTGGDDPSAEGTPTPKFSEAPSSSPASPDASASASNEAKSPKQVARAMVAGVGRAINTGNTKAFLQFTRGCENCDVVASNIEESYKGGRSARSAGWRIARIKREQRSKQKVYFSGVLDAGSQDLLRPNGRTYKSEGATSFDFQMRVEQQGGQWLVTGWDFA